MNETQYTKNTPLDERMKRVADINASVTNQTNSNTGMVQTGVGSYVNPNYISSAGIAMAQNFGSLPKTINSDLLSGNETLINLSEQQPSTTSDRIAGRSTALIEQDALAQKAAQETADRQAKLAETEQKQFSILERIGLAKKEETAKGNEEFGLDPLKATRQESLQNIKTSQVQELAELKGLETANMTAYGKATAQAAIKNKYGMEQLQNQLTYYLANDNITAAEETINDRIALATEPLSAQLDLTKDVYNQISDSLSNSEDREWALAISDREQAIQQVEELEKYRGQIALTYNQNNGKPLPSYIQAKINRAGSQDEINQILSDEGISLVAPSAPSAPTIKSINGADMQWDAATQSWITPTGVTSDMGNGAPAGELQLAQAQGNIELISNLTSSEGLNSAVGPNANARVSVWETFTGKRGNFIAGIEQLASQLSLDSLIQAKSKGATFGALSDREMQILSQSATKIANWAVTKTDKQGKVTVTGYQTTEPVFRAELDKINDFAKLDYLLKGGNPANIGATQMPNGKFVIIMPDGNYKELN